MTLTVYPHLVTITLECSHAFGRVCLSVCLVVLIEL